MDASEIMSIVSLIVGYLFSFTLLIFGIVQIGRGLDTSGIYLNIVVCLVGVFIPSPMQSLNGIKSLMTPASTTTKIVA